MQFKNEILSQERFLYMRKIGPYGPENYKLMHDFKAWAKGAGFLREHSVILGIAQDNPKTAPPEACRYDVGILVDNAQRGSYNHGGVIEGQSPHGKYAVVEVDHTPEAVEKAWSQAFACLDTENYSLDYSRPILERYDSEKIDQGKCELCFPVL
ncbi:AraC family transcriptional regulator [Fusibacter sp. JL216-2]|uniref:AraC family transcriptional regulator n=1 Tax=Fusibacter sp. JL216-2 TaxID=3071453 RepID=UPI003D33D61F